MPFQIATSLRRASWREWQRVQSILRAESVGGLLLLVATAAALIWANVDPHGYEVLSDTHLGADLGPLHLNLSIAHWAADGLLAVFFFLAGLELKREFVAGDLRDPSRALVPVVAAACGVAVPALVFTVVNLGDPGVLHGWAIPTATDIAFALAVLAVIGSHLPSALRTFLLTLAVVDDLIAIAIIAIFYAGTLHVGFLGAALIPVAAYAVVVRRWEPLFQRSAPARWLILFPLALAAWVLVLNSGIHATVAGVVLGFTVPARPSTDDHHDLAHTLEHWLRPLSAGAAVPVFAFFAAGVTIESPEAFLSALTGGVGVGIVAALVAGKMIGVWGGTWLVTRLERASLDPDLRWIDVFGLATLSGIGFTVSLLISELSFGQGTEHAGSAKVAILTASLLAALIATAILGSRNLHYRALERSEAIDSDADGIPDKFQ